MAREFLKIQNNATSTLLAEVPLGATKVKLIAGGHSAFPSTAKFDISIGREILRVTAISADEFTVERAVQSSVEESHGAGSTVELRITAKLISDLNEAVNALETGGGGKEYKAKASGGLELGGTESNEFAIAAKGVSEAMLAAALLGPAASAYGLRKLGEGATEAAQGNLVVYLAGEQTITGRKVIEAPEIKGEPPPHAEGTTALAGARVIFFKAGEGGTYNGATASGASGAGGETQLASGNGAFGPTSTSSKSNGGEGGAVKIKGGNGGGVSNLTKAETSGSGGKGGSNEYAGGAGGESSLGGSATNTGGAGGGSLFKSGRGGSCEGATSGEQKAGKGGANEMEAGAGGDALVGTGKNVAGAGGGFTMKAGAGGKASGGSTNTYGKGGRYYAVGGKAQGNATGGEVILEGGEGEGPSATGGVVEIIGGPAPTVTLSLLSSSLTTGGPITALPVNALTNLIGSGATLTLNDGAGHTQTWKTTAISPNGTTSIPVTSQTPNFAYPKETTVVEGTGTPGSVILKTAGTERVNVTAAGNVEMKQSLGVWATAPPATQHAAITGTEAEKVAAIIAVLKEYGFTK